MLTARRPTRRWRDLLALGRDGLAAHPCVGPERVEFVLPGCAVFAAIRQVWPVPTVTVADRGLREGMLLRMMRADRIAPRAAGIRTRRPGAPRRPEPMPRRKPPGPRGLTVALRTARGRTTARQKWLQRQLNDPYVRAAQAAGCARAPPSS